MKWLILLLIITPLGQNAHMGKTETWAFNTEAECKEKTGLNIIHLADKGIEVQMMKPCFLFTGTREEWLKMEYSVYEKLIKEQLIPKKDPPKKSMDL